MKVCEGPTIWAYSNSMNTTPHTHGAQRGLNPSPAAAHDKPAARAAQARASAPASTLTDQGGILHIGNSICKHHNANACTKCARKKVVVLPLFPWKMLEDIVEDVHTYHTKAWKT